MTDRNYGLLDSADDIKTYVRRIISEGKPFGFDIESGYDGPDAAGLALLTFHPNWKIVGFSFTNSDMWARYIPIAHDNGQNAPTVATARLLWVMLQTGLGVAHNASFELQALSRWFREVLWDDPILGAQVQLSDGYFPVRSDSMIEAFMLQRFEPRRVGIGLKGLTKYVFGHQMTEFLDLFPEADSDLGPGTKKTKRRYVRFNTRNLVPQVIEYACEDALWCLKLHEEHFPEVENMLMFKTEILLLDVLARMEKEGLALDWDEYERRASDVAAFKERMNEQIQKELGQRLGTVVNVNLGSPKQVADLLYNQLSLPVKEYTDTGQPSTGEGALRALAKKDPAIKQILQWREVGKLLSSYITKYTNELSYATDGRAHPNHKQTGAATGRMSVDHVSYQQWPKPYKYELDDGTTLKLNYRDFLIAPPGYRIVGFDFSQVELRILAGMANETALLDAFAAGTDIHVATASTMMGIPLDQVTKKQRAQGKTLNFAVVYGSGAQNIADMLTSPEAPVTAQGAQELLDKYFAAFSKLKGWMDERVQEGKKNGHVFTKFGRKFKVWEYEESDSWIRAKGDRMCVNAPVQGGAADYLKLGMVRVSKAIKRAEEEGRIMKGGIRLVMTVHDALEFYVHESISTQDVIDLINPAVSFPVPGLPEIKADWHEGRKWGSVVEIDLDAQKKISGYGYEDEEGQKHHFGSLEDAYAHMDAAKVAPAQAAPEPSVPENYGDWGTYPGETDDDYETGLEGFSDEYLLEVLNGPDTPDEEYKLEAMKRKIGPWAEGATLPEEPVWAASEHRIILTLRHMPLEHPWRTFKLFMNEHLGKDLVVIRTPEGDLPWPTKHTLEPQDVQYLSHLLNGVEMTREEVSPTEIPA